MTQMYRHESDDRDSSETLELLSVCIIQSKKCNLCIEFQDEAYYIQKEIFEPHQDFKGKDCHRRNCSVSYCGRANRE